MYQSVDVSWPQNNYTPDAAEAGVIVAATSADGGSVFTQSTFVQDVNNCRAAGKPLGFYHFNGLGSATAQADYFWAVIKPYYRPGDVVALDIESSSGGTVAAMSPGWAAEFMNRLAANIGVSTQQLRLLIYGNRSDMRGAGWGGLEAAGCLLWLACPGGYPENSPVGEWSHWTVLQYSTAGGVDRDESQLTFAQISQSGEEMTPEQANQLAQIYNALFNGGPSMPDGKQPVAKSIADIHALANSVFQAIFTGGTSMPDGHESIGQSLADLKALLKQLAAVPPVSAPALTDTQIAALSDGIAAKLPANVSAADVAAALKPALDALPAAVVKAEGTALNNG